MVTGLCCVVFFFIIFLKYYGEVLASCETESRALPGLQGCSQVLVFGEGLDVGSPHTPEIHWKGEGHRVVVTTSK